ncbi:MAG: hypothetical protein QF741_01345 [Candidatus Peribacteraceae bacterium]|jgi:hypothetical protein|nr:hypothetical protein [Candidatus Peribacteraceae bacterium]MDP7453982.1 hypothetical protein [Candidatus Peribacteraceae bacterium]MDP7645629.1 hypothetical protein [Candidatus Peribacteraceae bacterium]
MQKQTSTKAISLMILATILFVPATALAYLLPEEVLQGNEMYTPPRNRDMKDVVERQAYNSATRRKEEYDIEYERQHPTPPEPEVVAEETDDKKSGAAMMLTSDAMELLRTVRLLERVDQQQALKHTGAPPLAPTGAPAILSAMAIMSAAGWTVLRSGKKKAWTSRKIN